MPGIEDLLPFVIYVAIEVSNMPQYIRRLEYISIFKLLFYLTLLRRLEECEPIALVKKT